MASFDLHREARFGNLLVSHGVVGAAEVKECLDDQLRLSECETPSIPSLGELLIRKRFLTVEHHREVLRLVEFKNVSERDRALIRDILGRLGELSRERSIPTEVSRAGENPDNRVGRYIRVEKVGSGGMGEVWKGWDTELFRWVALKFLKHTDGDDVARFQREAQTAGRLNHPNIAAIYEVGQAAGRHFIAMQYVEGRTLSKFPRVDRRVLVELIRDAAVATHAAHEQGVIHRDLKPDNLMVEGHPKTVRVGGAHNSNDRGLRLYVMDFGLAKALTQKVSLSQSGLIVGTPTYMSPEQARGMVEGLDARSDVYSLGASLYELLTDRPPFRHDDVMSLLWLVVSEDPRPVRRRNPHIDRDLETIVMKCLEKDPARRYLTAWELAEDLRRYLEGDAIEAHPPSAGYRLAKWARRRAMLIGVAALGLAGVGAGGAFGVTQLLKAVRAERAREEESRRAAQAEDGRRGQLARQRELEVRIYPIVERAKDLARSAREMQYRSRYPLSEWRAKLDQAEALCRESVEIHPGYAPAYLVTGLIEMERGRLDAAISAFTKALEKNPDYSVAYLERAKAYAEKIFEMEHETKYENTTGQLVEAERRYMAQASADMMRCDLERVELDERRYLEVLAEWLTRGPEGIRARARELDASGLSDERIWRVAGEAEHRRGAYEHAAECYQRYMERRPGDVRGWSRLAHMKSDRGDHDGAIADCTRAIAIDAENAAAYATRGVARYSKGDLEGAIADCTKAIEIDPDNVMAFSFRGHAYQSRQNPKRAIADYTQAIRIQPGNPGLYFNRGDAYRLNGDLAAAILDYSKTIEIFPGFPGVYSIRGLTRQHAGDLVAAVADCTRAIEIDPKNAGAYHTRGVSRQSLRELEAAIADYTQAIRIQPRWGAPY